MRKLKLLFAACALLLGVGQVYAQNLEAGTYYLYNVQAAKYVSVGANWGTRSVFADHGVDFNVTVSNGAYTLGTKIVGADKALRPSDGFMDQSGTWTVAAAGNGTYTIQGSAGYLRYDGTSLPAVDGAATDEGIYWEFRTKAALTAAMSSATVENPVDATHFITAPDFWTKDYRITTEKVWTNLTGTGGNTSQNNTIVNNTNGEIFNSTDGNVSQTLTGLPKGTYRLQAYGFYRQGGHGPGIAAEARTNGEEQLNAVLYAGDEETLLMSLSSRLYGRRRVAGVRQCRFRCQNHGGLRHPPLFRRHLRPLPGRLYPEFPPDPPCGLHPLPGKDPPGRDPFSSGPACRVGNALFRGFRPDRRDREHPLGPLRRILRRDRRRACGERLCPYGCQTLLFRRPFQCGHLGIVGIVK